MKFFIKLILVSFSIILFSSCESNDSKQDQPKEFSLELIDSVQIDYLGDMMLMDYDPTAGHYLLSRENYSKRMEVNEQGDILNIIELSSDGINGISAALGLGYFEGKVGLLTPDEGFILFENEERVSEITIPYPYQGFMFLPQLGLSRINNRIFYSKLWPETFNEEVFSRDFFLKLYRFPILESLDPVTKDTLTTMYIPEESDILDGNINGFPIPITTQFGDKMATSLWIEPKIYLYSQQGNEYVFDKMIAIEIPGWIPYVPVKPNNAEQFFEENMKFRAGTLSKILKVEEYYLAVYQKGITADQMASIDVGSETGQLEIQNMNPFYAAVFDQDWNQVATDLPFPKATNFPNVVNKSGEVVVSKNINLSDTEDDGMILYKLKLKVQ